MKRTIYLNTFILAICVLSYSIGYAQTYTADYYKVRSGNGKGIRFWNGSTNYEINMGNGTEYNYGPVTSYSIKHTMYNSSNRGFTWGAPGLVPTAALTTRGNFQIAGFMKNMNRNYYFGDYQRLYGDNAAALHYHSKHSTATNLHFYDKEGTLYGKVYGSGNGSTFGLQDGNSKWFLKSVKNNYITFYVNNSEKMRIKSNGYVGVGTNTPGAKLHAKGFVRASFASDLNRYTEIGHGGSHSFVNAVGPGNLEFRHDNNTKMAITSAGRVTIPATTDASGSVGTGVLEIAGKLRFDGDEILTNSNTALFLQNGNNGDLRIDGSTFMVDASTNRVGINTTSPNNALDVLGTIRSNEVKVELGWSDYVFNEDYKVPTLEEEERHIKENKHLLGFESEKAMNGEIQLGDVSRRQQAKIEEMMLHLIEINKTVQQMDSKISQLEQENTQLKEQLLEKGE